MAPPDNMIELARRAVACKGFRWMPGMKDLESWRLSRELPLGGWDAQGGEWEYQQLAHHPKLPDLSDPATLGCLLALVREAWGNPRLVAIYCEAANPGQSEGWAVQVADNRLPVAGEDYATEAEALVAALEAAPTTRPTPGMEET